jgi:hypothetical protein
MNSMTILVTQVAGGFMLRCKDPVIEAKAVTEVEAIDNALEHLSSYMGFAIRHVQRLPDGSLSVWSEHSKLT